MMPILRLKYKSNVRRRSRSENPEKITKMQAVFDDHGERTNKSLSLGTLGVLQTHISSFIASS
jgi:hypothetical protein